MSLEQPLPAAQQRGPSKEEKAATRAAEAAAAREQFLAEFDAKDAAAVERVQSQKNIGTRHVALVRDADLPGLARSTDSGRSSVDAEMPLSRNATQRFLGGPQCPQGSACTYDLLRSVSPSTSMIDSMTSDADAEESTPSLGDLTPKLRRLRGAPREAPLLTL